MSRLRADQGRSSPTSKPAQAHAPPASEPRQLTLAEKLQKQHEEADREREKAKSRPKEVVQQAPPSPFDFPTLGSPSSSISSKANTPTDTRPTSYANAAMSSMPKSGKATTTPRTSLAAQETAEDEASVIMSPSEGREAPAEKSKKPGPHFAQPTQSYSRRAGETLRKEASKSPTKSPPEMASTRSITGQELNFATEKHLAQRQQKRKSLPGDWMGDGGQQDASRITAGAAEPSHTPAAKENVALYQSSPTKSPTRIPGPVSQTETAASKGKAKVSPPQQSPRLQKKTSSYMAPTSATSQRAAATQHKDKPKRDSPSPKKRAPKLDLTKAKQASVLHSPEITAGGSDTSSVQFILDRPAANLTSPPSRAASPVVKHFEEQQAGRSSPVFGSPRNESLNLSPTKQVRKSRMIEHFSSPAGSSDQQGTAPSYGSLYSTPPVENTKTVRRTSHGHILKPILDRLNAQGLTKDTTTSPQSSASAPANERSSFTVPREGTSSSARGSEEKPAPMSYARVLAPLSAPMRIPQGAAKSPELESTPEHRDESSVTGFAQRFGSTTASAPRQSVVQAGMRMPSFSSLRATAEEFTPAQQPVTSSPDTYESNFDYQLQPQQMPSPSTYNISQLTAFRPPEEWLRIPPQTKLMINSLRSMASRHPVQTLPARYGGGSIWNQPNRRRDVGGLNMGLTVDGNGSPQVVQPGQALKAGTLHDKKGVHWTLQSEDADSKPLSFGRAGAPPPPAATTNSPTSDAASPPQNDNKWSIGSAASAMPYGWTGGDGKEIRFVGYGPHAERDPHSAVNFDFRGQSTEHGTTPHNTVPAHKEEAPNLVEGGVGVAPRSQKQWAQKLGLDRVPCGKVEVVSAVEGMLPFATAAQAYCFDCYGR